MYFLAIISPSISPQLHYFSHNAVIYSRHILAIFLARVKPLIHITRNRTPYRGAETATEDMLVPPEMPVNVCIEGNVTSSVSPSLRFLDFSRQTLQRSGFRLFFNLNVVFQRYLGTRAVTEYLGNGFDWRPLLYNRVPRPRRNAWKPCHSTPVPSNVFLIIFDPRVAKSRGKHADPRRPMSYRDSVFAVSLVRQSHSARDAHWRRGAPSSYR